jgi:hydrogenase nickel incorporation protein HypB
VPDDAIQILPTRALRANVPRPGADPQAVARANRSRLERERVFAVNIVGGAGSGKTSLIQATLQRLSRATRTAVITADPSSHTDAQRLAALAGECVHVDTGQGHGVEAPAIADALTRLDLATVDLLLIENVSSLIGPCENDLGETKRVAVFSVAAGDDKLAKYADVVQWADVLVLNKVDLLASFEFDLDSFRQNVRRINPNVACFELSARTGEGIDAWVSWLRWESHLPVAWSTNSGCQHPT